MALLRAGEGAANQLQAVVGASLVFVVIASSCAPLVSLGPQRRRPIKDVPLSQSAVDMLPERRRHASASTRAPRCLRLPLPRRSRQARRRPVDPLDARPRARGGPEGPPPRPPGPRRLLARHRRLVRGEDPDLHGVGQPRDGPPLRLGTARVQARGGADHRARHAVRCMSSPMEPEHRVRATSPAGDAPASPPAAPSGARARAPLLSTMRVPTS